MYLASLSLLVHRLNPELRHLLGVILGLALLAKAEYLLGLAFVDAAAVRDAVQALLHVGALAVSFFAAELALQRQNEAFSFCQERLESLAAFTSCSILAFECGFDVLRVMSMGLAWALPELLGSDQQSPGVDSMLTVRIGALRAAVNMVGLLLFYREAISVIRWSVCSPPAGPCDAHSENMASVALWLLIGTLSSGAGAVCGDTGAALLLALLGSSVGAFLVVVPMVATGRLLLLGLPAETINVLGRQLRKVSFTDGVLEVQRWKFLPLARDHSLVGALSVRAKSDADGDVIQERVRYAFRGVCEDLTVEVIHELPLDLLVPRSWANGRLNTSFLLQQPGGAKR